MNNEPWIKPETLWNVRCNMQTWTDVSGGSILTYYQNRLDTLLNCFLIQRFYRTFCLWSDDYQLIQYWAKIVETKTRKICSHYSDYSDSFYRAYCDSFEQKVIGRCFVQLSDRFNVASPLKSILGAAVNDISSTFYYKLYSTFLLQWQTLKMNDICSYKRP